MFFNQTFRNNQQKNILLLLLFIFAATNNLLAQTKNEFANSKQIYDEKNVDNKPAFQGGVNELNKFITANYAMPDATSYNGKVIITFVIETDGLLTDFIVTNDIGYGTGNEAIRVF